MAIILQLGLKLFVFDVSTAYVHAPLKHSVYLRPPEVFAKPGEVCRIDKVLYGLVEAGQAWNTYILELLVKLGFAHEPTKLDPWIRRRGDDFNPSIVHRQAAHSFLRYLAGTSDNGLPFQVRTITPPIAVYTNADFAGKAEPCHSVSVFGIYVYDVLVYWKARRQTHVVLSTCESECMPRFFGRSQGSSVSPQGSRRTRSHGLEPTHRRVLRPPRHHGSTWLRGYAMSR